MGTPKGTLEQGTNQGRLPGGDVKRESPEIGRVIGQAGLTGGQCE